MSEDRTDDNPWKPPTLDESARTLIAAYLNRIEATSITFAEGTPND
jgi:hypothetical protein